MSRDNHDLKIYWPASEKPAQKYGVAPNCLFVGLVSGLAMWALVGLIVYLAIW
jgi:hypothetical protein